jgi:DNA-binding beta-propeller fold protein YncE
MMKILLILALCLSMIPSIAQQDQNKTKLLKQWETSAGLKTPESVLYDTATGMIFVSNIDGNPSKKDSTGFISTLSIDGSIINLQWVNGIDAPKGMGILKNHLFVTNIDEIVEIDIPTATILNRIPVEGSLFLNDIAIDAKTDLTFITDTKAGKVFILQKGKIYTWLEGDMFKGANGLYVRDGFLYIGTANSILKTDIATGELMVCAANTGSVDGLYVTSEKKYIYSDWSGSVFLTTSFMPKPDLLMNTSEQKVNAADFGIIVSKKMILIPTFADNKVVCYFLPDIK